MLNLIGMIEKNKLTDKAYNSFLYHILKTKLIILK